MLKTFKNLFITSVLLILIISETKSKQSISALHIQLKKKKEKSMELDIPLRASSDTFIRGKVEEQLSLSGYLYDKMRTLPQSKVF